MSKNKQFKAYKKLSVSLFCLVCVSAGIATASFSFSWFTNKNNVTRDINGYTAGAYFAGGSGKESDPYIIKNPIHLYNLAWLYYIGYFKGEEPYFKISQDLDMNGWVLPPIGTSTNPFNGHLDGQEHTISNLTVSNSFEELKARKPSSVSESDWDDTTGKYGDTPNILGLFGYISNESDDKGIPTAENIIINKENVNSISEKVLVGIAAGYVNGSLNGIYIDNSNVNLADNTKALGALNNETISNVSEYTSVGYCTEDYRTEYTRYETTLYSPKVVGNCTYTLGKGDGGEGGWGGSIDMRMLNKRLTYINATGTFTTDTTSTLFSKGKGEIKALLTRGRCWTTKEYYWNASYSDSYGTLHLLDGTCLPLSVDEDDMQLINNQETEFSKTFSGYTHKFHSNAKYLSDGLTSETVLKSNTGYLVSAGTSTVNSIIRAAYRQFDASTYYSGIPESFIDTYQISYDEEHKKQFSMFTVKDNVTYRILDDVNSNSYVSGNENKTYSELSLVKYKQVRSNFDIAMNGAQVYNGFHFQPYLPDATNTAATDYHLI